MERKRGRLKMRKGWPKGGRRIKLLPKTVWLTWCPICEEWRVYGTRWEALEPCAVARLMRGHDIPRTQPIKYLREEKRDG